MPPTVEKDWNFMEHPLVCSPCIRRGAGVGTLCFGVRLGGFPSPAAFCSRALCRPMTPPLSPPWAGLRKELEKLNQLAWQADEDTILGWADTEGYPVDGTVDSDGQYSKADIPEHTQYDTQSLAKFSFSPMFWRAMRFAEEEAGAHPAGLLRRKPNDQ